MLVPIANRILDWSKQTFRSFRHPNYRVYWFGQLISMTGTWMQTIALMWISYSLTDSTFVLGLVGFASHMPVLLFSLFAGALSDYFERRKILLITQTAEMFLAIALIYLIYTQSLNVTLLIVISTMQGIVNAFDLPARQALVANLVPKEDVSNAISLSAVTFNSTRFIGPAIGAVLMQQFGEISCFVFNAISFLAAIIAVASLKIKSEQPNEIMSLVKKANLFLNHICLTLLALTW